MVCQGGRFGGFSFYVKNGKPSFTYNFLGLAQFTVAAVASLETGQAHSCLRFQIRRRRDGQRRETARSRLMATKLLRGRIAKTQPGIFSVDDLADVGTDDGTWVADYGASAHFSGQLEKVTLDVHPAVLQRS